MEKWIPKYLEAMKKEILSIGGQTHDVIIPSIFFGGGTPSYLPTESLIELLSAIRSVFCLKDNCEISLEANPGTITRTNLKQLVNAGFNRISIGVQSARNDELNLMERIHDVDQAKAAILDARSAGFQNLSLDLIYGIPGQKMDGWLESLDWAIDLKPDHLSLYGLSIDEGTPFDRLIQAGQLAPVDEDLEADFYEAACRSLDSAGFVHYEISNWAKNEEHKCRHNLQYWRNLPYFGFGAGAHGYINDIRTRNTSAIPRYIKSMNTEQETNYPSSQACEETVQVTRNDAMKEHMMLGLRLLGEGVQRKTFLQRFEIELDAVFSTPINKLLSQDMLIDDGASIRLSEKAWLLGNQVIGEFFDYLS